MLLGSIMLRVQTCYSILLLQTTLYNIANKKAESLGGVDHQFKVIEVK